jgi:MOSC domain-containing protein YiiM
MPRAHVLSVNVGRPAPFRIGARTVISAFVKTPVTGPVAARGVNLEGDDQGDRQHHGGADQAVYAYAAEDAAWWEEQLGRPLAPAAFGENLALAGVDVCGARIGEIWRIGSAELRVAGPRVPCNKLATALGDPRLQKRFLHAGRPGAYLSITRDGVLQAGDDVEIVQRPDHEVSVALVIEALLIDRSRLGELAPAREDMLPKLARRYDEAVYTVVAASAAAEASAARTAS